MESKYVLAGWEYNDFYKEVEFYVRDSDSTGLVTTDEAKDAPCYDYGNAEAKRKHLQEIYNDYGWYLLRLND